MTNPDLSAKPERVDEPTFSGWVSKWFDQDGNCRQPCCPWCGEERECTPHCRSQFENGVDPDGEVGNV